MFWDDFDFILHNTYIKDWSLYSHLWTDNLIAGSSLVSNYYRPVLATVFAIGWHLWEGNTTLWHTLPILLHILDAVLVFLLLEKLFKRPWIALATALVFTVHPLQTEAVAYVNSMGDSLSTLFLLGSLYLAYGLSHLKGSHLWRSPFLYLSLVCGVLAILSKEITITIPALVMLVVFFANHQRSLTANIKTSLVVSLPYWILAGIYLVLRATILNFQNSFNLYNESNAFTDSILIRLATFCRIFVTYIKLLFAPFNQHMERTVAIASHFFSWDILLGAALIVALLYLALWAYKKIPLVTFGILWFFICLVPTSNILVPINGLLYEHWLYLPLVGFFVSLAGLTSYTLETYLQKQKSIICITILTCVVLCGTILTVMRNTTWHDPIVFYNDIIQYNDTSLRVWNNLGMAYADSGDFEHAITAYKKAVDLDTKHSSAPPYHNIGNALQSMGKNDEAISYFEQALTIDPHFIFSYSALINLYYTQGDKEKTIETLKRAHEAIPENNEITQALMQLTQ